MEKNGFLKSFGSLVEKYEKATRLVFKKINVIKNPNKRIIRKKAEAYKMPL